MDPDARRALVLRRTRVEVPPAVPELRLHLADDVTQTWEDLERELDQGQLPPPFWAFAWVGGQGLARYVLDTPHQVTGRTVLDLATGSGLVALAAHPQGPHAGERVGLRRHHEQVDPAATLDGQRDQLGVHRAERPGPHHPAVDGDLPRRHRPPRLPGPFSCPEPC